jgi:hypothetical protein
MRYYIKCKLNPEQRQKLAKSISSGALARGEIFYEGMQSALREGTIDENDVVHFVEICYCLEGGLYPMAMEIPVLKENFEDVIEVKDARLRDQCTMECEFCDCTRAIKLPGKPLLDELHIKTREEEDNNDNERIDNFIDIGRMKLNRKKQKEGLGGLRSIIHADDNENNNNILKIKPVFTGAAISGLFAIFYDENDDDYFRVKNIPDSKEARQIFDNAFGLKISDSTESMKAIAARSSLAQSDKRSNVV